MKMKKAIRMPLRRTPQRPRPSDSTLRARAATVDEVYDEEDYAAEEEPNMKFTHALFVVLVLHLIAVGGVFAFNWMKTRQTAETAAKPPVAEKVVESPLSQAPPTANTAAAKPANLDGWTGETHKVGPGDTLTHIASIHKTTVASIEKENGITSYSMLRVGQVLKVPARAKVAVSKPAGSSGATKEAFLATKTEAAPIKPTTGTITAVSRPASAEVAASKPAEVKAPSGAAGDVYVVAKGDNPYTIAKKLHVSYNALMEANGIKDATKIQIGQKLKVPGKVN